MLNIFAEHRILDVSQGSKYYSVDEGFSWQICEICERAVLQDVCEQLLLPITYFWLKTTAM